MGSPDAYQLLFAKNPQPLFIVSLNTMKFLNVNDAATTIYGFTKEEFLNLTLKDIRPIEDVPAFESSFLTNAGRLSKRRIRRHKFKDGSVRMMEINARTIEWNGEPARFIIAEDVTETLQIADELRLSEERLETAIAEAPYPVMIHAEGAKVIALSRSWIEGTGYHLDELKDLHNWTSKAFGDQADSIRQGVADVQNRRESRHQAEYRIRCKDGSTKIWDIVTVAAGQLSDGRNVAITSGYDLTEREKLASSLKLQAEALNAASHNVFIADRQSLTEWLNKRTFPVTQQSSGPEAQTAIDSSSAVWQALAKNDSWKGDLAFSDPNGQSITEEVSITPVKGKEYGDEHYIVVKQDVTQRRRTAQLIAARLALLERSAECTVQETLTMAADQACSFTKSQFGFFHFIAEDQETLAVQAWSTGLIEDYNSLPIDSLHLPISQAGVWAECVNDQEPKIYNNFETDAMHARLPEGHAVLHRQLIVPVVKNNAVVALMGLANKPTLYKEEDVEIAQYFADVAWETAQSRLSKDLLELQSTALQAADNAIIITNQSGQIEWCNPAFCSLTGYTEAEAKGKTPGQLVHSTFQPPQVYKQMWQTISANKVWSGDLVNRRKDGRLYIEQQTITPMEARSGEIEHYIGIKADVTKYRRSESLLQARLDFAELIKTEGIDGILKLAVDYGGLLTFSKSGCFKIFESSTDSYDSSHLSEKKATYCSNSRSAESETDGTDACWKRCLETTKPQISKSSDSSRRVLTVPVIRGDEIQATLSVHDGASDYTQEDVETLTYLADAAYETISQHLSEKNYIKQSALLEQLYDAVLAWKLDGKIIYWNKGAERLYGYSSKEALGESVHSLLRTEFSRYSSEHATALAIQDRWEGEIINTAKDGTTHLVESRMTLTSDPEGQLVLEVNRDITATRAAEEKLLNLNSELEERVLARTAELSIAKAEADKANSAKSEFLSRMSHELRTPLNSILGFSQILQLHHPDGEVKELSDPIIKAGNHLLELINEILDIARIEAGGLKMDIAPCRADGPINDALDLIAPLAISTGITVEVPARPDDIWINADSRRLVQVILNVLSNAVKYNSLNGKITLRWVVQDGHFLIRIQDTGSGISAANVPKLFEPFARFGNVFVEGTGLGLPLSQRLIHLMNGDLYLESSSPSGSTFVISTPLASEASSGAHRPATDSDYVLQNLVSGKILYIEDDLGNIQLMDHLVALFPEISLMPAMQGSMGLEIAKMHSPDLIILDAHLPDVSGKDVLKDLKADEATRHIPVVILTADAADTNREEMQNAGAAGFMTKPLNVEELMRLISATLGAMPS